MDKTKVSIPERFKDHPIFNETIIGTNFGFMAKRGYYLTEEAKKQPALMKDMGVNWTTLNMNFCQSTYFSRKVYLDFEFSSGESEILEMTKRLHDNGVNVLFKPCLTPLDGSWMGLVNFPDSGALKQIQGVDNDYLTQWFTSFSEAEKYFADLAERAGIDALIIGAEYYGTERHNEWWEKIIKDTKNLFSNPITYEFTHRSREDYDLEWMKELDFLSYSYYPPAKAMDMDYINNVTVDTMKTESVEEMKEYLYPRRKRIRSISERFWNKPIAFTEFGVRSSNGCIMMPYDFLWNTPYDGEEQANFMEASLETFYDLPEWMGFFWWKWDETQIRPQYHNDPRGNKGFTVQGKPAEEVMRKWAKKLSIK